MLGGSLPAAREAALPPSQQSERPRGDEDQQEEVDGALMRGPRERAPVAKKDKNSRQSN
jgi:hypothetical protein